MLPGLWAWQSPRADSVYDFMAVARFAYRPICFQPFRYDLPLSSLGLGDGIWENFIKLQAVPITSRVQFNSHHDYGWQDGPMIPNKGLQTYLNAGIYGKVGFFEFQYAPEWVWAAEPGFAGAGVRMEFRRSSLIALARIRTNVLTQDNLCQSAHWPLAWFVVGKCFLGTRPVCRYCDDRKCTGIRHFTFETNKPLKTRWGTLEGQLITGNKMRSGFSYAKGPNADGSSLPEVVRSPELDSVFSVITAAVGVWNPIWLPG